MACHPLTLVLMKSTSYSWVTNIYPTRAEVKHISMWLVLSTQMLSCFTEFIYTTETMLTAVRYIRHKTLWSVCLIITLQQLHDKKLHNSFILITDHSQCKQSVCRQSRYSIGLSKTPLLESVFSACTLSLLMMMINSITSILYLCIVTDLWRLFNK